MCPLAEVDETMPLVTSVIVTAIMIATRIAIALHLDLPPKVELNAAERIKAPCAAPCKSREALPPLASNDLLSGPLVKERVSEKFNVGSRTTDPTDGRTAPEV